ERCSLFDVNVEPRNMTAAQLQDGLMGLARRLYTKEERDARRDRFWKQRRHERRQLAGAFA
ncbi:MAG TPA: hypothetical protein VFX74_02545, partial [Candidatus Limnocylindria bacterium]|nr:hypothetical protein [Candidatus Limnocylindria bacterium]